MKRSFKVWIAAASLFVLFGIVGKMDYEDAARAQLAYCEQVEEGAVPAYKGKCDPKELEEIKKILQ